MSNSLFRATYFWMTSLRFSLLLWFTSCLFLFEDKVADLDFSFYRDDNPSWIWFRVSTEYFRQSSNTDLVSICRWVQIRHKIESFLFLVCVDSWVYWLDVLLFLFRQTWTVERWVDSPKWVVHLLSMKVLSNRWVDERLELRLWW